MISQGTLLPCSFSFFPASYEFPVLLVADVDGRALDESLHIESSERNFLIMTKYCAKAVFLDRLSKEGNWGKLGAWWEYLNTLGRVAVYGWWLDLRSRRYRFFVPRLFDTFWIQ